MGGRRLPGMLATTAAAVALFHSAEADYNPDTPGGAPQPRAARALLRVPTWSPSQPTNAPLPPNMSRPPTNAPRPPTNAPRPPTGWPTFGPTNAPSPAVPTQAPTAAAVNVSAVVEQLGALLGQPVPGLPDLTLTDFTVPTQESPGKVTFNLTLTGSPSSLTAQEILALRQTLADLLYVALWRIQLTFIPGSLIVTVTVLNPTFPPTSAPTAPTMAPSLPTHYPTPACCARLTAQRGQGTSGQVPLKHDRAPPGTSQLSWWAPTNGPAVDVYLPPGSTSAGGYLYNADYYLFGEDHCLGSGVNISITCTGTPHCAVYAFVYHQPPFSADTNGGLPQLANSGWQARSRCAPQFGNASGRCPMLGLRYNLMEDETVRIEQAAGTDLQYFFIAVVARKNCLDNNLDSEGACLAVPQGGTATTCVWDDTAGACEEDWCPLLGGGGSGGGSGGVSSSGGGSSGGGGRPAQCPVDLDCSDS
eukprot:TRINITY_DN868_c1_g1_i4.p1 TRINITY_DN868_c1_g1~~TRINITY_DN868_c1_g1_i4.p1  ORF type:complete len:513 (+),score=97.05 TRINITY_DN868_c1_g1_i4:117-1541(+)